MKVAVAGKGGVGKTLIAGGLAAGFAQRGFKTIAIDADSSPNLALTLGLSAEETRKLVPVSDNKPLVDSKTQTEYSGVYKLSFSVDDIVRDYSNRAQPNCDGYSAVNGFRLHVCTHSSRARIITPSSRRS